MTPATAQSAESLGRVAELDWKGAVADLDERRSCRPRSDTRPE